MIPTHIFDRWIVKRNWKSRPKRSRCRECMSKRLASKSAKMHYPAIDENEPAGKPLALCKKISVKLSLHRPEEDLAVYKKSGLSALSLPWRI